MQTGNETWKWGVVFILLAIFLITANQAYQHVTSQEHFEPPDDYLKGDSWDIEHQSGPGAGQAIQLPPAELDEASDPLIGSPSIIPPGDEDAEIQSDEVNWDNLQEPLKAPANEEKAP